MSSLDGQSFISKLPTKALTTLAACKCGIVRGEELPNRKEKKRKRARKKETGATLKWVL